ncbi:HAD hydrolase family protein [Halorubrum lacusprofundi]|jgi:hydroxymethylpyrimidine pyrophosphatase-like HAD family hydrolase|uniref:Haloacid dehalogenase domain protein hydrolase type 3 n=1 Tax=Halorubrum lacusprofundi (strain ATCC 49239 / DSM 5036 / JCM 8891 / ACAM 34) TaxID=416348 RepID=B9LNF1_HALLT|nr:HAD hydrolase family protein [Halorubrum lacusprofundi]ACM56889.1 Haloacid dehalogenase domain protein hydrolase type 3 [Halorubrum lacusprofundi ATCC 49239]MCG1006522.1 HAD hydrolase family protein [Halorubrum lacusprofundi]
MERHDLLYRLYDEFDVETLREYQSLVDLFPPVDSRVALEHWEDAGEELARLKREIREALPAGATFAEVAAYADREAAFTALDLHARYDRAVNALVLDVDETLRSAGGTDNEIPRETLHMLTELHDAGVPIVICTGQTLENVKGFMIQGLGNELVHSGRFSIVYEAGNGVFTAGHGSRTKCLLYEDLDEAVRGVFGAVRSRVLPDAPENVRRGCHLQGNEFNVTLKPNFETGGADAEAVIDDGLIHLIDLLGEVVVDRIAEDLDPSDFDTEGDATNADLADRGAAWARAHYAAADPEIREVIEATAVDNPIDDPAEIEDVPEPVAALFDRIDVGYYRADAAEISSLELDKVAGVEAALDVLDVRDPFLLVMGDSKSDLRVMEWAAEHDAGIAAAPEHASADVLSHVLDRDELVFGRGQSATILRTVYVLNLLAQLE